MKEMATGMTQTMPLYLIIVGVVLIIALAYLLIKMAKKGKEEKKRTPKPSASVSIPQTPNFSSEQVEELVEGLEPKAAPEPPTHVPTLSLHEEKEEGGLPVQTEPFEESPEINRQSFERFSGKRVLVVEDNPVNRKLILTLMGGTGIELDSAEDGVEALEKLRAPGAHYDLVLMDVNMPKMDGLECTRRIREDASLKNTPVLALTASTTPEEVEAILESGMNGYLDKPLNLGKLYTAFARFTEEYQMAPSPAREGVDLQEEWNDSQVLDTTIGKEHTNNDLGLYRMLLQDFYQQYGESDRQFASLVAAKDYDGLRALIVDLEGLAGTLGAMELYRLLLDVNQALKQGTTMLLPDYAEEYKAAFQRLKAQIERYLA